MAAAFPERSKGWVAFRPDCMDADPPGSISAGAWSTVCKRVLVTGEELVKGYLAPAGEYSVGKTVLIC